MADVEGLRLALFEEMRGRIKEDDFVGPGAGRPVRLRDPLRARRRAPDGRADASATAATRRCSSTPTPWPQGKAYFRLGGFAHSPDHRLIAYSVDDKGAEYFTIHVRDIETGADLADVIEETTRQRGVGERRQDALLRLGRRQPPAGEGLPPRRRHRPQSDDVVVYADADPGFFIGVGDRRSRGASSSSRRHDHETSEVRVLDADDPDDKPRLIARRQKGAGIPRRSRRRPLLSS